MKQILFTTVLCLIFNASQAWIVVANCPEFDPSANCIGDTDGVLTVHLTLIGNVPNNYHLWKVDFTSVIYNVSTADYYTEYGISAVDIINGGYDITVNKEDFYRFGFNVWLKNASGSISQTVSMPDISICNVTNSRLSSGNQSKDKFASDKIDETFNVFPNPFSDYFSISGTDNITSIQLFDINGILVYSNFEVNPKFNYKNLLQMRVDNLNIPKGIYSCNIKTERKNYNIKLTKM